MKNLEDVRQFWEKNPLWDGETSHQPGTKEFFEEHRQVVINDCLAGKFDDRLLPAESNRTKVLDLGCGPGFWTVELSLRGCTEITAADLTKKAIELTGQRCDLYGITAELSIQNAEALTFEDKSFNHVNCQGVIHHTPDTESCVREIARVLKDNGTASISVYYRNIFIKAWPLFKYPSKLLSKRGGKLQGRGREQIFAHDNVDEIVRFFDGAENPIGKAFSRRAFIDMLEPYFHVDKTFLHFFPARALPFQVPARMHRFLDKNYGFMIYANLRKR